MPSFEATILRTSASQGSTLQLPFKTRPFDSLAALRLAQTVKNRAESGWVVTDSSNRNGGEFHSTEMPYLQLDSRAVSKGTRSR
jgi:hypothetical protein